VPKAIDWLYARKSCVTCKKAAAHCAAAGVTAKETVDATKVRMGQAEALELVAGVSRLVAARGKSVVVFELKADKPEPDALLAHLMGPTGNLRAPTARVGKTLLVGFHPDAYRDVLGS
jgi:arsenate reductase-like glutaredoxin family protein